MIFAHISQEISLPPESGEIRIGIDRCEAVKDENEKEIIEIVGWAFVEGQGAEDSKIYLVLKSETATCIFDTISQRRRDVTAHFVESGLNLDNAGFIARISVDAVKVGTYKLGIYIRKGDIEALQYVMTHKVIVEAGNIAKLTVRMSEVDDNTFNKKYYDVVDVFKQWMPKDFDFSNSTILDFGCEHGIMALGIAIRLKPKKVIGVDVQKLNLDLLNIARARISINILPSNLEFYQIVEAEKLSVKFKVDVIFTWSVFEHISQLVLDEVVADLHNSLSDNGWVFLQVAPLYYSPFGSHLETLIDVPWAHLQMQTNVLHRYIMNKSKDATIYKAVSNENYEAIKANIWYGYGTLNRITADEIIELFERNGFARKREYRTKTAIQPPKNLCNIYSQEILQTEQIVVLFQKTKSLESPNGAVTCPQYGTWDAQIAELNSDLQAKERSLNMEIRRRDVHLKELYASISWRIIRPLRFVGKLLKFGKKTI